MSKIGLGGGCHWCTEGIFLSVKGVKAVEQGWIRTEYDQDDYSEGIIVHFDPKIVQLKTLIDIHLQTHASTAEHSMRHKYRSAIYTFSTRQLEMCEMILLKLQDKSDQKIITQILNFGGFRENTTEFQNYFYQNPEKPFCRRYIQPKLKKITEQFPGELNLNRLSALNL